MKRIASLFVLAAVLGACSSSTPSSDPQANEHGGSGSVEAYCALALEAEELSSEFSDFDPTNVDATRSLFAKVKDILGEIEPEVPAEIRADFVVTRDAFLSLIVEFENADYDLSKLSTPEIAQRIAALTEDPEVTAAQQRLEAFDEAKCGIDAGGQTE